MPPSPCCFYPHSPPFSSPFLSPPEPRSASTKGGERLRASFASTGGGWRSGRRDVCPLYKLKYIIWSTQPSRVSAPLTLTVTPSLPHSLPYHLTPHASSHPRTSHSPLSFELRLKNLLQVREEPEGRATVQQPYPGGPHAPSHWPHTLSLCCFTCRTSPLTLEDTTLAAYHYCYCFFFSSVV
ncbi:hypothetical protein E2C01_076918 [Portunus trituberculatus]|uniref:Uncharacterized protein n=1 Tax=Portunus trituberculatus TaxID=210409 RepID=A0A5B7IIZ9_PORTR|nr:hypothetical protein [Portunus trituberculatus]